MSDQIKKTVTINGKPRTVYKRTKTNTWYYVSNGKRIDYVELERNDVFAPNERIILPETTHTQQESPVVAQRPVITENSYLHKYYSRIYASYKRTPFIPKQVSSIEDYHYVSPLTDFDSHKNTAAQVLELRHKQRMRVLRFLAANNM